MVQKTTGAEPKMRRAFTVETFGETYGLGRTKIYAEIRDGRLMAVKVGARTLIPADAAEAWLASLPALARGEAA